MTSSTSHKNIGCDPRVVAVQHTAPQYPTQVPYHPSERYPELHPKLVTGEEPNGVYAAVRDALLSLGYDRERAGTPSWNPMSAFIRPGDKVLLKPNLIRHSHSYIAEEWEQILTHGSLIRAVVDYVLLALEGKGSITIADGPQTDSDFDAICGRLGLRELCKFYEQQVGFPIRLVDLRNEHWIDRDGVIVDRVKLQGDPAGTTHVNMGDQSMFANVQRTQPLYGAFYDIEETNRNHSAGLHRYAFSRTAIESDVVINLPKLKTHKKTGVTINLKNLVGLNTNKNLLPHYTFGAPANGGDQFPRVGVNQKLENGLVVTAKRVLLKQNPVASFVARRVKKLGYRIFGDTERVVRSGNWYGNDTIWRTVLDLNRILFYAHPDGSLDSRPLRRYFSFVDGIIAGDHNGPVSAKPYPAGLLLAGCNPVAVDAVATRLMGFDVRKVPVVGHAFDPHPLPLIECAYEDLQLCGNRHDITWEALAEGAMPFQFEPHFGWKGHIEFEQERVMEAVR